LFGILWPAGSFIWFGKWLFFFGRKRWIEDDVDDADDDMDGWRRELLLDGLAFGMEMDMEMDMEMGSGNGTEKWEMGY